MNVHTKIPKTPEEFLIWNAGRDGKREFVLGKVVELEIGASRDHSRICTFVMLELTKSVSLDSFDIGTCQFAVRTHDGVRFADVLAVAKTPEARGTDLIARHPVFLAEVLSPDSVGRDFGEKVEDYKRLPTLLHYLILSQDEPRAWLWSRIGGGWFGPAMASGREGSIDLSGLGSRIKLANLYRGIA